MNPTSLPFTPSLKISKETGLEPASLSMTSWHSTIKLFPLEEIGFEPMYLSEKIYNLSLLTTQPSSFFYIPTKGLEPLLKNSLNFESNASTKFRHALFIC